MESERNQNQNLQLLTELEQRISDLLKNHDQLIQENVMLKKQQEKLALENATLNEKHRQAQSKVESILNRLKTLEQ